MSADSTLKQAVLDELGWEPRVSAAHIGVVAESGIVTLSGHVGSYAEKHAAETAAGRVKGVKGVAEEIEVRLPNETRRSDAEVAAAAVQRMMWDSEIPADAVHVHVEAGWVTLSGEVAWFFQKTAAVQDVRGLMGVVGVSDHVTVKPRVNVGQISDAITHALDRSWFFDTSTIHVNADGGRITLTGTARTLNEKATAGSTAWAAPGVVSVENDIAVI